MEDADHETGAAGIEGGLIHSLPSSEFSTERLKFEDPWRGDHTRKGLLLSNQIEWFCERKVLISDFYKKERVRPASYTLTIGPDYVDSNGRRQKLSMEKAPYFYMEPNSIVYVSTAEKLNLPHYIAARFNLRVKWVYRGILLGTGPQVEPGYVGNLSCPLFNLTDLPIRIDLFAEFATIDFERTTDFGTGTEWTALRDGVKRMEKLDSVETTNDRFLLFKQDPYPPLRHLPDHDIISSLVKMQNEVKQWRAIGVGILVAFVGLALTLLNFQANLYREQKATSQQVFQLQNDVDKAKSAIEIQKPRSAEAPPNNQNVAPAVPEIKNGSGK